MVKTIWSEHFRNDQVISYKFPKLLLYDSPEEYEELIAENPDFQKMVEIAIPSSEMEIKKPVKYILLSRLWHYLSTLIDCIGCSRFSGLIKVAKLNLRYSLFQRLRETRFFASQNE